MYRHFSTQIKLHSSVIRMSAPQNDGVAPKEVVVTFESAVVPNRTDDTRLGFAEKFLIESGYACVTVLCNTPHWYRPLDVREFIKSAYLRNFLKRFERIHTYGSSMGGFAALAFADTLRADNVIALAPITSLHDDFAPWEKRFRNGYKQNWNTQFNDAAKGIETPKSIWLVYDPLTLDMQHVERLRGPSGDRLLDVPWPQAGHAIPNTLLRTGALKELTRICLTDTTAERAHAYLANIEFEQHLEKDDMFKD